MQKFPSIEQYRHVIRRVRDCASHAGITPPTITFRGTVKLHGTNAGVTLNNGELTYQSRNRILKPGDDNAGFVHHMEQHRPFVSDLLFRLGVAAGADFRQPIQVFGEWCGEGIQSGVGITQGPKRFMLFSARVDNRWIEIPQGLVGENDANIGFVGDVISWDVDIDFQSPELMQNALVELTELIEECCPIALALLDVEGVGEGVVWRPVSFDDTVEGIPNDSQLWFKVKGEKHSSSKVSTLAAVDVERIQNRDALVEALVTASRLDQGLQHFLNEDKLELKIQNIGTFLRWVFNDIAKEETDTVEASGFTIKELGKPISDVAKRYFTKALDTAALAA
jgi:hypothetical protein